MSQVSHEDGATNGENNNRFNSHGQEGAIWGQHRKTLYSVCLALGVTLVLILIVLPAVILNLANIFPQWFPTETAVNALNEFHNGVNEAIAWVSLIVGVVSIAYSYKSDKTMDRQSQQQQDVLYTLQQETVEILKELSVTNERMAMMSEKSGNLGYHPPSGPENADEE